MNLEELKKLLAEAMKGPWRRVQWGNEKYPFPLSIITDNEEFWIARDGTTSSHANADLIVAAVNALPELIAIAEQREAAYAAGRADQRKEDAELARDYGGRNPPDGYATREGVAQAIEEQGK